MSWFSSPVGTLTVRTVAEKKAAKAKYDVAYRAARREHYAELGRAWRAAHPTPLRYLERKAYMQAYWARRRAARRAMFYTGVCADGCGATANLDRDHLDPSTKRFNIGDGLLYSLGKLQAEVNQTELVCRPCHAKRGVARRLAA